MKKNLLIFFLLFGVIYFFTNGLLNTFFQQDEWNGFGLVTSITTNGSFLTWFQVFGGQHFFPLGMLFWALLYEFFGIQAQYFALTGLILHTIASLLVYLLTRKLSNNAWIGILTAILFATSGRASQTFTHIAIFPATITSFIAIMSFLLYLVTKMKKRIFEKKDLFALLLLFLISVFFREDGLILMPLLLAYLYIYNKGALNRRNLWFFSIFYTLTVSFVAFRFAIQLVSPVYVDISSKVYLSTYLYNAFTFPVKLIVQNLIEGHHALLVFIYEKSHILYPIEISIDVMNTILLDFGYLVVFNVFVFIFFVFTRRVREKYFWRNVIFSCFFILVSAGLLATLGRRMGVIESRYLYLSSFSVLFILSLLLVEIYKSKSFIGIIDIVKKTGVIVVILALLITSYSRIQDEIRKSLVIGKVHQQILSDITNIYPTIPKNVIFFVRCREDCYRNDEFGLPNDIVLPFSSGPGWIIMLHYAQNNKSAYAPFFTRYDGEEFLWNMTTNQHEKAKGKEFLWDFGSEGYRRIGDYGFGYFINMSLLKETLEKENLNKSIVIGLEYDEKNFKIKDISPQIRSDL